MNDERSTECEWARLQVGRQPLSAQDSCRLERHLAACAACRETRDWDDQLAVILRDTPLPPVGTGIERRVHMLRARRRTLQWSVASAAIAATVTLMLSGPILWWLSDAVDRPLARSGQAAGQSVSEDPLPLASLTILASEPPVPILNRPQAAWLAVLTDSAEGELP